MSSCGPHDPPPLIEPAPAPEFHFDGVVVELVDHGLVRLWFYSQQHPLAEATIPLERVVSFKAVASADTVNALMQQLTHHLDAHPGLRRHRSRELLS